MRKAAALKTSIKIGERMIGSGYAPYVIAELSANHNHSLENAVKLIHAAKDAGADAVKLQTYTPETMTIQSSRTEFQVQGGTLWDGKTLFDLYGEAYTPWEWHGPLQTVARQVGIDFFSTPFDLSAVGFLKSLNVPAYKVASFELVDHALLRAVAKTGKPVILSTGLASLEEIKEAVTVLSEAGCTELALLKCTSAYPAPIDSMNLRTISDLMLKFPVPIGLSDHSMGVTVPVAAIGVGATIIEKHFTLSRDIPSADAAFSLEPSEFKILTRSVREAYAALGTVTYQTSQTEQKSKVFRRSLFIVKNIKAGEKITQDHVRSIRPGNGLAPKHLDEILGKTVKSDIERGTPLTWEMLSGTKDLS